MAANATSTLTDHVIGCLRRVDFVALTDRYAPDALLDLNLPAWRLQLQGREAIKQYFAEQTPRFPNSRCTQLRELVTGDAVVVESECRFDGLDGECLWRGIDLLRFVGEEIVEHTQYFTGSWTSTDIARQAAEAPMLRW